MKRPPALNRVFDSSKCVSCDVWLSLVALLDVEFAVVFVFEFESIKGLRAGSVLMQLLLLVLAIDAAFSAALDDEEDEEAEDDEVVVE